MASSLPRRIAVAAVGIPTALGLVWLGGWPLVGGLVVLALVGAHEVFRLAEAKQVRPLRVLGFLAAAAAPAATYLLLTSAWLSGLVTLDAALAWFLGVMAAAVLTRPPERAPLSAVAITVLGPLYVAVLPSFLLVLRHGLSADRPGATALVFLPLAIVWACDTAAMGVGAAIGGPKFAPVISPKKTWSGTIGGVVAALVVGPLYGWWILRAVGVETSAVQLAVLGLALGVLGQVGDLAESLFKRDAGVKDSGGFFPGHGGVLDRLDSLYWALPTTAMLLTWFGVR